MEMVKFEQQILNIINILPWTKVIGQFVHSETKDFKNHWYIGAVKSKPRVKIIQFYCEFIYCLKNILTALNRL